MILVTKIYYLVIVLKSFTFNHKIILSFCYNYYSIILEESQVVGHRGFEPRKTWILNPPAVPIRISPMPHMVPQTGFEPVHPHG